jgi:hypothetical protein
LIALDGMMVIAVDVGMGRWNSWKSRTIITIISAMNVIGLKISAVKGVDK